MSIGLNCESNRVEQSSRTSLRKIGKGRERDDDVQSEEYEEEFADRKAKKSRVFIDRRVDTEGKMDGRTGHMDRKERRCYLVVSQLANFQ